MGTASTRKSLKDHIQQRSFNVPWIRKKIADIFRAVFIPLIILAFLSMIYGVLDSVLWNIPSLKVEIKNSLTFAKEFFKKLIALVPMFTAISVATTFSANRTLGALTAFIGWIMFIGIQSAFLNYDTATNTFSFAFIKQLTSIKGVDAITKLSFNGIGKNIIFVNSNMIIGFLIGYLVALLLSKLSKKIHRLTTTTFLIMIIALTVASLIGILHSLIISGLVFTMEKNVNQVISGGILESKKVNNLLVALIGGLTTPLNLNDFTNEIYKSASVVPYFKLLLSLFILPAIAIALMLVAQKGSKRAAITIYVTFIAISVCLGQYQPLLLSIFFISPMVLYGLFSVVLSALGTWVCAITMGNAITATQIGNGDAFDFVNKIAVPFFKKQTGFDKAWLLLLIGAASFGIVLILTIIYVIFGKVSSLGRGAANSDILSYEYIVENNYVVFPKYKNNKNIKSFIKNQVADDILNQLYIADSTTSNSHEVINELEDLIKKEKYTKKIDFHNKKDEGDDEMLFDNNDELLEPDDALGDNTDEVLFDASPLQDDELLEPDDALGDNTDEVLFDASPLQDDELLNTELSGDPLNNDTLDLGGDPTNDFNITNDFNEPISDDSFELNDNFNLEPETNFDPSLVPPFEETTEAPIADADTELNMLDASLANNKKAEVVAKEKPIENKDEGIKLTWHPYEAPQNSDVSNIDLNNVDNKDNSENNERIKTLEEQINILKDQLANKQEQPIIVNNTTNNDELAKTLETQINALRAELLAKQQPATNNNDQEVRSLQQEIANLRAELLHKQEPTVITNNTNNDELAKTLEAQINALRDDLANKNNKSETITIEKQAVDPATQERISSLEKQNRELANAINELIRLQKEAKPTTNDSVYNTAEIRRRVYDNTYNQNSQDDLLQDTRPWDRNYLDWRLHDVRLESNSRITSLEKQNNELFSLVREMMQQKPNIDYRGFYGAFPVVNPYYPTPMPTAEFINPLYRNVREDIPYKNEEKITRSNETKLEQDDFVETNPNNQIVVEKYNDEQLRSDMTSEFQLTNNRIQELKSETFDKVSQIEKQNQELANMVQSLIETSKATQEEPIVVEKYNDEQLRSDMTSEFQLTNNRIQELKSETFDKVSQIEKQNQELTSMVKELLNNPKVTSEDQIVVEKYNDEQLRSDMTSEFNATNKRINELLERTAVVELQNKELTNLLKQMLENKDHFVTVIKEKEVNNNNEEVKLNKKEDVKQNDEQEAISEQLTSEGFETIGLDGVDINEELSTNSDELLMEKPSQVEEVKEEVIAKPASENIVTNESHEKSSTEHTEDNSITNKEILVDSSLDSSDDLNFDPSGLNLDIDETSTIDSSDSLNSLDNNEDIEFDFNNLDLDVDETSTLDSIPSDDLSGEDPFLSDIDNSENLLDSSDDLNFDPSGLNLDIDETSTIESSSLSDDDLLLGDEPLESLDDDLDNPDDNFDIPLDDTFELSDEKGDDVNFNDGSLDLNNDKANLSDSNDPLLLDDADIALDNKELNDINFGEELETSSNEENKTPIEELNNLEKLDNGLESESSETNVEYLPDEFNTLEEKNTSSENQSTEIINNEESINVEQNFESSMQDLANNNIENSEKSSNEEVETDNLDDTSSISQEFNTFDKEEINTEELDYSDDIVNEDTTAENEYKNLFSNLSFDENPNKQIEWDNVEFNNEEQNDTNIENIPDMDSMLESKLKKPKAFSFASKIKHFMILSPLLGDIVARTKDSVTILSKSGKLIMPNDANVEYVSPERDKYILNIYGVKFELLMNANFSKKHKQHLHNRIYANQGKQLYKGDFFIDGNKKFYSEIGEQMLLKFTVLPGDYDFRPVKLTSTKINKWDALFDINLNKTYDIKERVGHEVSEENNN